jgi:hypothetical protein
MAMVSGMPLTAQVLLALQGPLALPELPAQTESNAGI